MPDIAMCLNSSKCPLAKRCYRAPESATMPDEYRQAWMEFTPTDDIEGFPRCDGFMPVSNNDSRAEKLTNSESELAIMLRLFDAKQIELCEAQKEIERLRARLQIDDPAVDRALDAYYAPGSFEEYADDAFLKTRMRAAIIAAIGGE